MKFKKIKDKKVPVFEGFFDLNKFKMPIQDKKKFVRIQRFLCEKTKARKEGKISDQEWEKLKTLSADYQTVLLEYERRK